MKYRLILRERAIIEINDAYDWYEDKKEGLGELFLEEFKEYAITIFKNPASFRTTYKKFREVPIKNFPFIIVYFIDDRKNKIIIISVFHTSRNPKKKFRK